MSLSISRQNNANYGDIRDSSKLILLFNPIPSGTGIALSNLISEDQIFWHSQDMSSNSLISEDTEYLSIAADTSLSHLPQL